MVANFEGAVPLLFATAAAGIVAAARIAYVRYRRGQPYPAALLDSALTVLVVLVIFDLLVIALMTHGPRFRHVQFLPLQDLWETFTNSSRRPERTLVIGNALLFVPLGFLLPLRFRSLDRFWSMALLAAGFSLLIEVAQFLIGGHESSVDDVIVNTLSALAGMLAMRTARALFRAALPSPPAAAG